MYLYGYDPEFAALLAGDDDDLPAGAARWVRILATLIGLGAGAGIVAVLVFL